MPGGFGRLAELTRLTLLDALRQHPAVHLIWFVIRSIVENFRVELGVTVRDITSLTVIVFDRELPLCYHFICRSFGTGSNFVPRVLVRTGDSQAAIHPVMIPVLLVYLVRVDHH